MVVQKQIRLGHFTAPPSAMMQIEGQNLVDLPSYNVSQFCSLSRVCAASVPPGLEAVTEP